MDKKLLDKFIQLLGEKVSGNWIIIGGSVLPWLGASCRHTKDIDIVGPKDSSQMDTLLIMEIAQSLGLPIEAINQAAAFFLYRISDWEKNIVLIYKGHKASVFRPNATLYILLKLKRFSEGDYEDCLNMIEFSKNKKESIRKQKILESLQKKIKKSDNKIQKNRLQKFLSFLKKL